MFLIEVGDKKILHTGDFRDHGYLGKGLCKFVPKFIGQVDVLITEGTILSRASELVKSESQLQNELKKLMQSHKYIFIICSSTDMDRLATFHKSIPKGSLFVCDRYQKEVLDVFSTNAGAYSDLYRFEHISVFPKKKLLEEMINRGFCMLVRPNKYTDKYWKFTQMALNHTLNDERIAIYSMWNGYIDRQKALNKHYVDFLGNFDSNVVRVHTSGHASMECLSELCNMTNPRSAIIPIHSEYSEDYLKLPITDELKSKVTLKSKIVDGISIVIQ